MRLNLGCGGLPLPGYINVDAHAPEADIKGDIRELTFEDVEEVVMYHLLEHLPWAQTYSVLQRIRSWMRPGARIKVEVPDMEAIMASPDHNWVPYVYGSQSSPGEYHMAGFNHSTLRHALMVGGFSDVHSTCFISKHPNRPGMPCVEATGVA